jgi:hypothetical protein
LPVKRWQAARAWLYRVRLRLQSWRELRHDPELRRQVAEPRCFGCGEIIDLERGGVYVREPDAYEPRAIIAHQECMHLLDLPD